MLARQHDDMKENKLRAAMQQIQEKPAPAKPAPGEVAPTNPSRYVALSRQGKRGVTAFFAPEVTKQLRLLAAEEDRTVQSLMEEALNEIFRKFGKSPIA